MKRFKSIYAESMADDSRIKSLTDKIEYLEKRKENSSSMLAKYRDQMNNTNNSDEADRIQKQIDRSRDGLNKHNEELQRVREQLSKAKEAYKSRTQNEAIEADDISVGKKKKVPAGVKVDPNLKGYAYNEKRVTDIDVEQGERDLKLAKSKKAKQKVQNEASDMSLDDIKKRYAKEIIAFQDGDGELSHGAKMAMYGYHGSDAIKTDDPDEFDKFVLGLQMGKYKKTNEQQAMDTLLNMLDETNLDEALSPKEKEKRLLMIKKAVEKLNRANLEKVKRMAMRDMKAAGMFDDAIEEGTAEIQKVQDRNDKLDDQIGKLEDKKARLKDLRRTATVTDRIDAEIKTIRDQISKFEKEMGHNRVVIKNMRNAG